MSSMRTGLGARLASGGRGATAPTRNKWSWARASASPQRHHLSRLRTIAAGRLPLGRIAQVAMETRWAADYFGGASAPAWPTRSGRHESGLFSFFSSLLTSILFDRSVAHRY
jgi:hypothetical protein